jgi:hypothetical protein
MKKFSRTFLIQGLSPLREIQDLAVRQLRRNIPGWAGCVGGVHKGTNKFDMKDTAHATGVANPAR